jgi:non-heme chloroperoxidase
MDFDKLKQQWAAHDSSLDSSIRLNTDAARAATLTRSRRTLGWHRSAARFEMLASLPIAVCLGAFAASHWGAWRFVLPAVALLGWTLFSIGFNVQHLRALAGLDFTAPITRLVELLRVQYRARVRYARGTLAASALLWVCWVVVILEGMFGIDVYAGGGISGIAMTELACVLMVAAVVVLGRLVPRRPDAARRLRDRLAGYAISAALAQLEDLDGDEARTLAAPPRKGRFYASLMRFIAALVLFWLVVGLALVQMTGPHVALPPGPSQCRASAPSVCVTARDGMQLAVRRYPGSAPITMVLVHGFGKDSASVSGLAASIRDATGAEVWTPDLRGHGASQGRRGDVDYTNQYEHDLADVIAFIRTQRPEGKMVIAGYELGATLALRYARRSPAQQVDGYVLLAPALGNNAPTERPGASLGKFYQQRAMGIMMLHGLGISAFDGKPVMAVNGVEYSYRAMQNAGIVHYRQALAADSKPMLVLVGERDAVLDVANFPATFAGHAGSKTVVLPGAGHSGVLDDPLSTQAIANWLETLR